MKRRDIKILDEVRSLGSGTEFTASMIAKKCVDYNQGCINSDSVASVLRRYGEDIVRIKSNVGLNKHNAVIYEVL